MRIYIGFDDTDTVDSDRGTGKLARWFEKELPESCRLWGVVRQQLLLDGSISYTSHNSSACAIVETSDSITAEDLIPLAIAHIERHFTPGSDPGLCVASGDNPVLSELIHFGRTCTARVVTQKEAVQAALGSHLSGHGGTNDGIIGAAAAVGLTANGWGGRFIEFGRLRDFPEKVFVSDLERSGIAVFSIDRDAQVPTPEDVVDTKGWLRPRLWGGRPGLPVTSKGKSLWEALGEKRSKRNKEGGNDMAGKIFYRERGKVGKGEKKPRFRLVAIAGFDMKVYGKHLRKSELEQIAKAVGAKLILLKGGEGKHKGEEEVEIEE